MDEKKKHEIFEKAFITDSLRQEFKQTMQDRVQRYLQVKPHEIIPNAPFAAPSSECSLLFRDGHFYACISLIQAVTEAIVRYICDLNFQKHDKVFEKNVEKLCYRKFIDDKLKESLLKIWDKRDDYHHLNSSVKADRLNLEQLAMEKAFLLVEVESEIFKYTLGKDGSINPDHPKYWKISGNQMEVFLRLDP
jgi:hypothetical protein